LPTAGWALANHRVGVALLVLWTAMALVGASLAVRRIRPDTR
jgi:hypothetical protein